MGDVRIDAIGHIGLGLLSLTRLAFGVLFGLSLGTRPFLLSLSSAVVILCRHCAYDLPSMFKEASLTWRPSALNRPFNCSLVVEKGPMPT